MAENKNAQQVREITDKLEQGIKELFESERFKEYLRTMSKFYNYSFNNTLLIAMQKPEATYGVVSHTGRHINILHDIKLVTGAADDHLKGEGLTDYCWVLVYLVLIQKGQRIVLC